MFDLNCTASIKIFVSSLYTQKKTTFKRYVFPSVYPKIEVIYSGVPGQKYFIRPLLLI